MRRPQYITSAQVPVDPENIIVPSPDSSGNIDISGTPAVRTITGATDTITQTDSGKMIKANRATGQALTVTGPISAGFNCLVRQANDGQSTFDAAGGATLVNSQTHTKTSAKYAVVSLTCDTANEVTLAGDTA